MTILNVTANVRTSLKCWNYSDPDAHINHEHYCIGEGESTYEVQEPSVKDVKDFLRGSWNVTPVTEVYVVEWDCYQENAVVLVTLDKAQAETYAAEKNAKRIDRLDVTYRVSPWTLGEPDGDFS